jgi:maltoporin
VLVCARMRLTYAAILLALLGRSAFAEDPPADQPPPESPPAPARAPAPATTPMPEPPPPAAPVEPSATKPPDQSANTADIVSLGNDKGFRFGSYGRVISGTDLRGGKPEKILVVAHGPRIVEDSYLELDMSYGFVTQRGVKLRPVITLAFDGTLFHDTGEFDAHPALRNLFLDAQVSPELTLWAGSRMYRGDDIYLFDYWPLDNQNTLGAGAFYRKDAVELAVHGGTNRLLDPFQYQQIQVANPVQGSTTVLQLNRQRLIASVTAAYLMLRAPEQLSMKFKVHAQVHELPSGTRAINCDATGANCDGFENLPSDSGYLVGAEASFFGMAPATRGYRRHLNLFMRYAKGLAAFDELAPPTSFGIDYKTTDANELSFGASGNWDAAYGNMMIGALSRRWIDASGNSVNPNNGWEYAIDARPLARLAPDWFVGGDISYQARFPQGFNPITLKAEDPAVFQLAPMVVYSPMGPSAYDRPQLRFVYRVAHLNDGALDNYVPGDPRHAHPWQYFLGVQAEWWWNSSTYR